MNKQVTAQQAEIQIQSAFLEVAAQIDWLARYKDLGHPYWDDIAETLQQVEVARQRYLAGEYQLYINVLPEF